MWLCNAVKRVNFSQVAKQQLFPNYELIIPTSLPLYFILSYEVHSLVAELFEPHTAIPNFPSLFRIALLVNESSSVIASY